MAFQLCTKTALIAALPCLSVATVVEHHSIVMFTCVTGDAKNVPN
jgi:hypothetical protein